MCDKVPFLHQDSDRLLPTPLQAPGRLGSNKNVGNKSCLHRYFYGQTVKFVKYQRLRNESLIPIYLVDHEAIKRKVKRISLAFGIRTKLDTFTLIAHKRFFSSKPQKFIPDCCKRV
ncbi:hypothetical protein CDAR_201991 [Caerostris darwini]|uniref:Uncharacterized protein n=1 Tax=Caerostris darwini TaxID=1538125 RepID=A0AAV4RPW6_9ARAC|nr:hypothetical protein CDAR_201991 [Caerostris darwini]